VMVMVVVGRYDQCDKCYGIGCLDVQCS